jgi:hypothetical protein
MRGIKLFAILMVCALVLILAFVIGKRDVAAKDTSTLMVLKLLNGEEVVGRITFDNRDTIELEREPEAPNIVVMKQAIAYYYEY